MLGFGRAAVRREGADVTIVGISRMAVTAERAAQRLEQEHGVQAEVIDPRTLRPLDLDTILRSVAKTNRCVVVEEGWPHGGVGANLSALISEQAFDDLDAPDPPRDRRGRPDAVLQAARGHRLPARAADRGRRARGLGPGAHGRANRICDRRLSHGLGNDRRLSRDGNRTAAAPERS